MPLVFLATWMYCADKYERNECELHTMTDFGTTIEYLQKVDELDQRIQDVKARLEKLPEEKEELDNAVAKAEEALAVASNAYIEKNAEIKQREEELSTERDNAKKSQNRLNTVKNNMEYSAVMREINAMKRDASNIEETVLGLMEELEGMETIRASKHEAQKEAESKRAERIAAIENGIKEAQKELDAFMVERDGKIAEIPRDFLNRYDRIRARYDTGSVIVTAQDERCMGCNMNIPPQVFNMVRRGAEFIQCPNCSRILIWREEEDADTGAGETAA